MAYKTIGVDSVWSLSVHIPTVAEILTRRGGYESHFVGKWDIGHSSAAYWPTARGFGTSYGLVASHLDNYTSHVVGCRAYDGGPLADEDDGGDSGSGAAAGDEWCVVDWHEAEALPHGASAAARQRIANSYEPGYSKKLLRGRARLHIAAKGGEVAAAASSSSGSTTTVKPLYLHLAFNAVHSTVSVDDAWASDGARGTEKWDEIRNRTAADPNVRTTFAGAVRSDLVVGAS